MIKSQKFMGPVLFLSAGFVFGMATAMYFAESGEDGLDGKHDAAVWVQPSPETVARIDLPDNRHATGEVSAKSVSPVKEKLAGDQMYEDISMLQTVDISRQEIDTSDMSPEELLVSTVRVDRVEKVSAEGIRDLENTLRKESETMKSSPVEDNAGLLGHEIL